MARIALIGMYDNWVIGLRTLSNALIANGHDVSIIHFKMPAIYNAPFFLKYTQQYQTLNTLHARDKVVVQWYNTDAVMWSHNEVHLLGDLLEKLQPDIIGLSTRCVYEKCIADILEQMKRVDGAITVAGGHDASFRPELYLDHLDFACIGEGEEALIRLADAVDRGLEQKSIHNLAYRENGKVICNDLALPEDKKDYFFSEAMKEVTHYLVDVNQALKVDYLLRDVHRQSKVTDYYTMLGRGCTGMCSFCSAGQFQQLYAKKGLTIKSRRLRKIKDVVEEAVFAKEKGFTKIYFLDSFFLAPKKYLFSFFEAYRLAGGLPFFGQLHPEQILAHPDILEEAIKAGLDETVIGIQSGSERVNEEVFNRKTPHHKIIEFADMCVAHGNLKVDYHVITHNPFEAEEDFEETLSLIQRLPKKGTNLILRPLFAFANTKIHQMIEENKPDPIDIDAHYKLLMLYLIRYVTPDHEFEQLRAQFDQMSINGLSQAYAYIKRSYKSDTDWTHSGVALLNQGKIDEAISAFDLALQQNHNSYRAFRGKGWAHLRKGEHAKAEEFFCKAIAQFPVGEVSIWNVLGQLMMSSGRVHKAIECYSKAKTTASPSNKAEYGQILLELGRAHFEIREFEGTRTVYTEALNYLDDPERDRVEKLLAKIDKSLLPSHSITPTGQQDLASRANLNSSSPC